MVAAPLAWVPGWLRALPAKTKAVNDDMHCPGPVGYVMLAAVFGVEVLLMAAGSLLLSWAVNVVYLAVAVPLSCCFKAGGEATAGDAGAAKADERGEQAA